MSDTQPRSFLDRQRDAALEQIREQQEEFNRIADIVLPKRRDPYHRGTERVTDVVRIGDDHLVEITDRDQPARWTFVVDGRASYWRHERQTDAVLHLIAARYDSNDATSYNAAFYAGRVLGLPEEETR